MALPKYGSDNSSLWTPTATGDFPFVTAQFCLWIDGEDDSRMTLQDDGGGNNEIVELYDKANNLFFEPWVGNEKPRFVTEGDPLVNERAVMYFWKANNYYDNSVLVHTASIDGLDNPFPSGDDSRWVYSVHKVESYWGNNNQNFIYAYGDNQSNEMYSLGIFATSSSPSSNPELYFLGRNNVTSNYLSGGSPLLTEPTTAEVIYQAHITSPSTRTGFISNDFGTTQYEYDSAPTLNTDLVQGEIWLGDDVGETGGFIVFSLCELIILGREPTTDDKNRIEGYLAHKWDAVDRLPSDHPYKVDPPYNTKWVRQPQVPPNPAVTNSFVINRYKNVAYDYARTEQVLQVPFSKGINGPSNIRKRITAHSSSL